MIYVKTVLLHFLLLTIIGCTLVAQESTTKDIEKEIDKIFKSYDNSSKPGAALAVVKNGEILFKKGYGSAQLEYNIPVSPSTVFHIASVSKQFTVFAILLLEEAGQLSFDDDIRKYIPEVPDFGKTITLRHLASHTSGLRDQWELLSLAGWRWDDVITKEHIMKLVSKQQELNFDPGEAYTYCNTGFTLLAEVVARVANQSFAEYTEEKIFKPLKMNNTLFYDDHEKIVKNRAYSYYTFGDTYKKSVLNYANVGATSLFTTVEDLAIWAMNFSKPKVGNERVFKKMSTLATLNNGDTFGGAYGQFVGTYNGLNQIQHGGADAGYRSYLSRFPDQDFAVMVFSNLAQSNPVDLANQVTDLYLADLFVKDIKAEPKKETVDFVELKTDQLEKFAGHYWNEADSYARKIYVRNDTLRYNRGPQNESPLLPISSDEFKMLNVGVDLTVAFTKQNGNREMVVTIDSGDPIVSIEFTPVNYTVKDLNQFIGTYYSPELSTYYHLVVKDEALIATHARVPDVKLEAQKMDTFSSNGSGNINFYRDEQGQIHGLKISNSRVKNLWFERVK